MTKTTATIERHVTLAGEELVFPTPTGKVAVFLERLRHSVEDPNVSEADTVALIYGAENPILDQNMFPGRGAVTPEIFASPLYSLLTDLLDRKRVQVGSLVVAKAQARYTMSVSEAARELGVTTGAVRQAITAKRIGAWKDEDDRWRLDPEAVRTYRDHVGRRGPAAAPALEARVGNVAGASMKLKAIGSVEVGRAGARVVDVEVPTFRRAAVSYSGKSSCRTLIIEPAARPHELAFGPFHVRGRFKVVEEEDRARQASELFKAFEPE